MTTSIKLILSIATSSDNFIVVKKVCGFMTLRERLANGRYGLLALLSKKDFEYLVQKEYIKKALCRYDFTKLAFDEIKLSRKGTYSNTRHYDL